MADRPSPDPNGPMPSSSMDQRSPVESPAPAARTRDPWLDNVRLLAIILVVLGHALGPSRGSSALALTLSNFVYMFHIPLFALTAGWTAQRLQASFAGLGKMTWQLLIPYAIFQSIAIAQAHLDGLELPWQLVSATFALWFLMSLFLWRLLVPWFRGNVYGVIAAVVIALAIGFTPDVNDQFSLSRTLFFFPAFLVGATYGDQLAGWLRRNAARIAGAAMLAVALIYCALNAETMNRLLQLGRDPYDVVGIPGIEGVAARLVTIGLGIALALGCAALVPRRRLPITHLGAYTMYAYLLHVVIRRVLISLDLLPRAHDWVSTGAVLLGGVLLTLLLTSKPVRLLARPLVEPVWIRDLIARGPRRHAP